MPFQATQETTYHKTAEAALRDIQEALGMIGEVDNVDHANLTIEGSSRYGLQKVHLRVEIVPQGETTIITIKALGDDWRAVGAKCCIARLLETIDNLGNPDYRPDRRGIRPLRLVLQIIAGIVLVLLVMAGLALDRSGLLWAGLALLSLITVIYLVRARKRFASRK